MNFNFINTWLTCISVGAERNVGKALVVAAEEEKEEETEQTGRELFFKLALELPPGQGGGVCAWDQSQVFDDQQGGLIWLGMQQKGPVQQMIFDRDQGDIRD